MSVINWTDFTPAGGLMLFVLLVGFGLLVPRWTYNQWTRNYEAQITYLRAIIDKREEQLADAMRGYEVVVKLLEDIKHEAVEKRGA